MRRWPGEVEKEWLVGFGLSVDVFDTTLRGGGDVCVGIPAVDHRAWTKLPVALFDGLEQLRVHDPVRRRGDAVVLDPAVGWEVDNGIAEVVIETVRQWSVGYRLRPIERFRPPEFSSSLAGLLGVRFANGRPVPAEVPLADGRGGVALFSEHFRHSQTLGVKSGCPERIYDAMEFTPMVATG